MVTPLVLLLVAVIVVVLLWGVFRHERTDETERFNRAREITSSWAEPGPHYQTVPDAPADEPGPAPRLDRGPRAA